MVEVSHRIERLCTVTTPQDPQAHADNLHNVDDCREAGCHALELEAIGTAVVRTDAERITDAVRADNAAILPADIALLRRTCAYDGEALYTVIRGHHHTEEGGRGPIDVTSPAGAARARALDRCNCGCGATAPPNRCECGQRLGHA